MKKDWIKENAGAIGCVLVAFYFGYTQLWLGVILSSGITLLYVNLENEVRRR